MHFHSLLSLIFVHYIYHLLMAYMFTFLYDINCLRAIGPMAIPQTGKDLHMLCSLIQSECLE